MSQVSIAVVNADGRGRETLPDDLARIIGTLNQYVERELARLRSLFDIGVEWKARVMNDSTATIELHLSAAGDCPVGVWSSPLDCSVALSDESAIRNIRSTLIRFGHQLLESVQFADRSMRERFRQEWQTLESEVMVEV